MKKILSLSLLLSFAAASPVYGWGWSSKVEEPKITSYDATTQLFKAAMFDNLTPALYEKLMKQGACHSLNTVRVLGGNLLDVAILKKNQSMIDFLTNKGLKPTDGMTDEMVLMLLENNSPEAEVNLKKRIALGAKISPVAQQFVTEEQAEAAAKCSKLAQAKGEKDIAEKTKQCAKAQRLASLASIVAPKPVATTMSAEVKAVTPAQASSTTAKTIPCKK